MKWYQQLRWKLFFSHITTIAIAVVVLLLTASFIASVELSEERRSLADTVSGRLGGANQVPPTERQQLQTVIEEALLIAGFAALGAAVVVSLFVSRRIVEPLLELSEVSQRLAQGYYRERTTLRSHDEMAALSANINELAEALQRSEEQRMRLIADVTHELRTPLTTIEGYLEGLIDGVLPGNEETYSLMQGEAVRLKRLTADLTLLSRAEAGELPITLQPFDAAPLLRRVAARYEPQFVACDIRFYLDLPPQLPFVEADGDRSEQVLINLLSNALRYTPSHAAVTLRAQANDEALVMTVADTGIGIAPEDLPRLFDRFYRADESRTRTSGGTGVGLTIARHLADAQGGALWVESAGLDRGAAFHFALPLAQEVEAEVVPGGVLAVFP